MVFANHESDYTMKGQVELLTDIPILLSNLTVFRVADLFLHEIFTK